MNSRPSSRPARQLLPEFAEGWLAQRFGRVALHTLASHLAAANVPTVPTKGIALGEWLYGGSDRPIRDVDLLIRRGSFTRCLSLASEHGYEIAYATEELGEITLRIDGFPVELHCEFGRRELTALSVDSVIERAKRDRLFGMDVLRIDDVDHLLLLAVNVVKDGFQWSNAHQPADLAGMLHRVVSADRIGPLLQRTREAAFTTGLYAVAEWMTRRHHGAGFAGLLPLLQERRRAYSVMVRAVERLPSRCRNVGLLLGCWSNDRLSLRVRAASRLIRRGSSRFLGKDPDWS